MGSLNQFASSCLFLVFSLSLNQSNAQVSDTFDYPLPTIVFPYSGVKETKIYYDFSYSSLVLDSLIQLNSKNVTCFIRLSSETCSDNVLVSIGLNDEYSELLNTSNRFFKSKFYDVPIVFDFDYYYSTPNMTFVYIYDMVISRKNHTIIKITKL
jgi:hypothetical protein